MHMQFHFDERKAAQAAGYLLNRHSKPMKYMKLMKLMYLADRCMLLKLGSTITGDRLVSMSRGPVLSHVLDLLKAQQYEANASWPKYVSAVADYQVISGSHSDYGALSDFDLQILDSVYAEFGTLDQWELAIHTHALPEWEDPSGSSIEIDPRVILRSADYSESEISEVEEAANAHYAFRRLLGE